MKKLVKILTVMALVILSVMSLSACNMGGNAKQDVTDAYVKYTAVDNTFDSSLYFKIVANKDDATKGVWSDNYGYSGNYVANGNEYSLYFGNSIDVKYATVTITENQFTYNGTTFKFKEAEAGGCSSSNWSSYALLGGMLALLIGFFIYSSVSNKKKQKKAVETAKALKAGDKVKTIGGICGVVSSVDDAENTFILETGDGTHKTYTKFDKAAIYQTAPAKEETPKQEVVERKVVKKGGKAVEEKAEEKAEEKVEEKVEEQSEEKKD